MPARRLKEALGAPSAPQRLRGSNGPAASRPPARRRGRADPGPPGPASTCRPRPPQSPFPAPPQRGPGPPGSTSSPPGPETTPRGAAVPQRPTAVARATARPAAGRERERPPERGGPGRPPGPARPGPAQPAAARAGHRAALTDLPAEVLQHPHLVAAVPGRHRASAAACAVRCAAGGRERRGPATHPRAAPRCRPAPAGRRPRGHQRPKRGGGRWGACALIPPPSRPLRGRSALAVSGARPGQLQSTGPARGALAVLFPPPAVLRGVGCSCSFPAPCLCVPRTGAEGLRSRRVKCLYYRVSALNGRNE